MSADGTGTKEEEKQQLNPGSSRRLPTEVLWYYSETGFVCFALHSCEGSSGTFYVNRNSIS